MITKKPSSTPGHVSITFEVPSSIWANRIFLTGDFNHWHKSNLPLTQRRDGNWVATLNLPIGRKYEFHYIVDDQSRLDYHADGFSSKNSPQNSIVDTDLPF